jgi:hypothetical protein
MRRRTAAGSPGHEGSGSEERKQQKGEADPQARGATITPRCESEEKTPILAGPDNAWRDG